MIKQNNNEDEGEDNSEKNKRNKNNKKENTKRKKSKKSNEDNKSQKEENKSMHKSSSININNKNDKNDSLNVSSVSKNINDVEQLKKRIKDLEKKADELERKNIFYYNIFKNNQDSQIDNYIQRGRNKNLNGYNKLMVDINDKIDDFIEYQKIKEMERIQYYNKVHQLKEDIEFELNFMKLLQEKEKEEERRRNDINRQFYILKYYNNSGEVSGENFLNNQRERKNSDLPHYGNPYDDKTFNNNYRKFMPAKMSKNGISLSNQYISIDNPSEFYKYQIYDRYNKEKSTKNILMRSGSSLINEKENYMKYKYNNKSGKKLKVSSSTDNIYYNK